MNSNEITILTSLSLLNINTITLDPPEPKIRKRWVLNLQYSDEFDGTSLDTKKWRNGYVGWEGRIPGYFSPDAISIKDGMLQIKNGILDKPVKEHVKGKYSIKGGAVQSLEKTAHYGYYETSFRASRIAMWTTFWMSNRKVAVDFATKISDGHCPKDQFSQELDIAESIGGYISSGDKFRKNMNFNTPYRYIDCGGGKEKFYSAGNNAVQGNGQETKAQLSSESWEEFHTYGAYWINANEVAFYSDNALIGDVQIRTAVVDKPFPRPMGINMVTETYNWATPYPTNDELTDDTINTSYYDWVRSYALVDINSEEGNPKNFNGESANIYVEEVRFFEQPSVANGELKIPYVYKANTNKLLVFKVMDAKNKVVFETTFTLLSGYGKDIKTIASDNLETGTNYTFLGELTTIDGKTVITGTEKSNFRITT